MAYPGEETTEEYLKRVITAADKMAIFLGRLIDETINHDKENCYGPCECVVPVRKKQAIEALKEYRSIT